MLPENWYDDCVPIGNYRPSSRILPAPISSFWSGADTLFSRKLLVASGEWEMMNVLPDAISKYAVAANLIEISNHRKRIFPNPVGRASSTFPTFREISSQVARQSPELALITPSNDFLIASPLYLEEGLLGQYSTYHNVRDLLDYASLAIETGLMDNALSSEFLRSKLLIPQGIGCGIFPKSWILETLPNLEHIGREFLARFSDRLESYDDYQLRTVDFLGERLGSFLLLRHLMDRYEIPGSLADMPNRAARFVEGLPPNTLGHLTIVTEGEEGYERGEVPQ